MHYVRFQSNTFEDLNKCGYIYDSTWFNKVELELKDPFKVGDMWEFPLHIMDVYLTFDNKGDKEREETIRAIEKAQNIGIKYFTILFHDNHYDDKIYPQEKAWYTWLINYLKENGYEFISYRDAIKELERGSFNGEDDTVCK
jgi:peptidoglycan/xylan/chitin deacetylase (PgdA/CDA1 family)